MSCSFLSPGQWDKSFFACTWKSNHGFAIMSLPSIGKIPVPQALFKNIISHYWRFRQRLFQLLFFVYYVSPPFILLCLGKSLLSKYAVHTTPGNEDICLPKPIGFYPFCVTCRKEQTEGWIAVTVFNWFSVMTQRHTPSQLSLISVVNLPLPLLISLRIICDIISPCLQTFRGKWVKACAFLLLKW